VDEGNSAPVPKGWQGTCSSAHPLYLDVRRISALGRSCGALARMVHSNPLWPAPPLASAPSPAKRGSREILRQAPGGP